MQTDPAGSPRRSLAASLALGISLLADTGYAQPAEPPARDTRATDLQTVKVTGPSQTDLRREDPTLRISIGREDILRHHDDRLGSVLRRLPGVTVTAEGIRMRGLGGDHVQILIDGDPAPAGFSIDSIAPELVERIEILPTAVAEYSTRSIAGTINIVLRRNDGARQRTLKISAGQSGADITPAATLLLSGKRQALAWSVSATASAPKERLDAVIEDQASDALEERLYLRRTGERYVGQTSTFNVAPKLTWTLGDRDEVSWNNLQQYRKEAWTRERNEVVLDGGPSDYPRNRWINDSRTWTSKSDGQWKRQIGERDTLDVKFGVMHFSRDVDFAFLGYAPDGSFALDRSVRTRATHTAYSSTGKYVSGFSDRHDLAFGWDAGYTDRNERRVQRDRAGNGSPLDLIEDDYRADIRRLALYAQDQWRTSPRLQTYLGLRWEGLDTAVGSRTSGILRSRSNVFSPIAQWVFKPSSSSKDQFRFGLARTFNAPQPWQLLPRRYSVNNGNGPTNPDQQGNPALRPEIAWGMDASYEHYLGKDGLVSLGAYARRVDDVILRSLSVQDGLWISTPYNAGRAQTHGLTLDTRFALADLLRTDMDLQITANLTRNWSRVASVPGPDNRLADQTPLSGNVGLHWQASKRFSSSVDYSYSGGGTNRLSAEWARASTPERTLDVAADWKLDEASRLNLSLSNVLQQRQGSRTVYRDAVGTVSRYTGSDSRMGIKVQYEKTL
ncbi:outer membrane beta-barrel protein [Stenotrophomonas cyclobalanopsidis]|uniref:Outer membrane beta-barrel protein n=1 Tax=Stenotrophomonas cyclobalanopsidis TaxID=2771362 RepID=A0ABQ6T3E4_9GAMM|nr:TonB-dependent receptor [Stenotrophomonas cyclobalanopsidis]KAA9001497.1 outer membrane beta-barrel protein [Stenotrophomonas cyclobalanopsidis]